MKRTAFVVVVVMSSVLLALVSACTKGSGDGTGGSKVEQQHESKRDVSKVGVIGALKDKKLADYTNLTIGEAFDAYRYFDKRDWKETRSSTDMFYVDFWGWTNSASLDAESKKNGIAARGIQVKFVIEPDGEFYLAMISKIEARADGKANAYPLDDKKSILNAIYGNKEIAF